MTQFRLLQTAGFLCAALGLFGASAAAQEDLDRAAAIVIGGGQPFGLYFPEAGAICHLYARTDGADRCLVDSFAGSVDALAALRTGRVDFALVQSDWQQHAVKGTSRFRANGPDKGLRSVFSLHGEALTLVARSDIGISVLDDLAGKNVDLGPKESYAAKFMEAVLKLEGLDRDELAEVSNLPTSVSMTRLCEGSIDAAAILSSHPNLHLIGALRRCDLKLIPLSGSAIDELLHAGRGLSEITIPAGTYRGQNSDVPTFGIRSTLVTRDTQPADVVSAIVTSTLDGLSWLRSRHPSLTPLDSRQMTVQGLAAPLHEGAARVYRERGLR